jgi:AcrR family transcriptional regulator
MDVNGPPDRLPSGPRPRRGLPRETRSRLIAAAAQFFNPAGFYGTDSNRIARAAGYSTGVFHKHFKDKREIFLAAYEEWSVAEWKEVAAILAGGASDPETARQLVVMFIDVHTRWRGLLASLRRLAVTDATVRRFHRRQRTRQLQWMAEQRAERHVRPRSREQDLVHLWTTERTFDGVAQGELQDLGGLNRDLVIEAMTDTTVAALSQGGAPKVAIRFERVAPPL